jgi:chorismate synthase
MLSRLVMLTAGESHGPGLTGILEGMPAGVPLAPSDIEVPLARRRLGFGRSGRQSIETDAFEVRGGIRHGLTTGAPISIFLPNHEAASWADTMSVWSSVTDGKARAPMHVPRPGHADDAGATKYDLADMRDILERASARETAMRVALGGVAQALLRHAADMVVGSAVVQIGDAVADVGALPTTCDELLLWQQHTDTSAVRAIGGAKSASSLAMIAAIEAAQQQRTTLGGQVMMIAAATPMIPIGLGSHRQWNARLSARLMGALGSIQSVKSVAIGDGVALASATGHNAHTWAANRAGGIEGGMTNGAPVVATIACKPLSTVPGGLPSYDRHSGAAATGHVERSDVCAVPSAGVVGEAMMAVVLADALLEAFGGDSLKQLRAHIAAQPHRRQARPHG